MTCLNHLIGDTIKIHTNGHLNVKTRFLNGFSRNIINKFYAWMNFYVFEKYAWLNFNLENCYLFFPSCVLLHLQNHFWILIAFFYYYFLNLTWPLVITYINRRVTYLVPSKSLIGGNSIIPQYIYQIFFFIYFQVLSK